MRPDIAIKCFRGRYSFLTVGTTPPLSLSLSHSLSFPPFDRIVVVENQARRTSVKYRSNIFDLIQFPLYVDKVFDTFALARAELNERGEKKKKEKERGKKEKSMYQRSVFSFKITEAILNAMRAFLIPI
jgi:hypothetical protein